MPQHTNPARKTVLERVVEAHQRGELTGTIAIEKVEQQGFSDVVPRFHAVNGDPFPTRFYETTTSRLVLTNACLSTM